MITKTALVGLAHFLMQADPVTAQHVLNQLPVQESEQVVQIIEMAEMQNTLPETFREKINNNHEMESGSPSHETSSVMP